jgi:hypothetical protein
MSYVTTGQTQLEMNHTSDHYEVLPKEGRFNSIEYESSHAWIMSLLADRCEAFMNSDWILFLGNLT